MLDLLSRVLKTFALTGLWVATPAILSALLVVGQQACVGGQAYGTEQYSSLVCTLLTGFWCLSSMTYWTRSFAFLRAGATSFRAMCGFWGEELIVSLLVPVTAVVVPLTYRVCGSTPHPQAREALFVTGAIVGWLIALAVSFAVSWRAFDRGEGFVIRQNLEG